MEQERLTQKPNEDRRYPLQGLLEAESRKGDKECEDFPEVLKEQQKKKEPLPLSVEV